MNVCVAFVSQYVNQTDIYQKNKLIVIQGQNTEIILEDLIYDDKTKKIAYTMSHQRPFRKFDIMLMQMSEITKKTGELKQHGKFVKNIIFEID